MASERNNFVGDNFLQYLYVLDSTYTTKLIIDMFSDFLWTEHYYGYGEFEITVPARLDIIQNCRLNDYIAIRESDKLMIVETIGVHTDSERGDTLVISGRSLESILDRRIIRGKFSMIGTPDKKIYVQEAIKLILENSIISPDDEKRKIEGFIFKESEDERIKDLTRDAIESSGEDVYKELDAICKDKELGFRILPTEEGGFEFELYFGTDRSWDQNIVSPVIFSDSYENLKNSDYLQSNKDYRSMTYINRNGTLYEVFRQEERTGLDRREMYITDSDSSSEWSAMDKGKEALSDYKVTKMFEGEAEPSRQFIYGVDYFLGDIVQLENKYGQKGKCRITEVVMSRDGSGSSLVPTFEAIEEDSDDENEEGGDK